MYGPFIDCIDINGMDIGKEDEEEIYITAPTETPVERPSTIPQPAETPEPVKIPAGV